MIRYLYIFIASALIFACSSVDLSLMRYTSFVANQDVESFYLSVPQILEDGGFTITNVDAKDGVLNSEYNGDDFKINVQVNYNIDSRMVKISITNTIKKGEQEKVEYYNLDDYNDDYKDYFYTPISNIRSFSTKTAFPNKAR